MTRPLLVVHWDGHVPGAEERYTLSFADRLPEFGSVPAGVDPWPALREGAGLLPGPARALLVGHDEAPVEPAALADVAARAGFRGLAHGLDPALLAPDGPVRATSRELTHHRRAVASNHWRLVRAVLHLLDAGDVDLVAVRLPALRQLAPLAQHRGHLRHALSLVNDVSERLAELAAPADVVLVATTPLRPLAPTPARLLGLDRRRRAPLPGRGFWRATRPLRLDVFSPPEQPVVAPRRAPAPRDSFRAEGG